LAATVKFTAPFPVPSVVDVSAIQPASDAAFHPHSFAAEILSVKAPPFAPML
jgi:hypothetical protein